MEAIKSRGGRTIGTRDLVLGVLLLTLASGMGRPQHTGTLSGTQQSANATNPMGQVPDATGKAGKDPNDPFGKGPTERQERMRNDERQQKLVADTDKLLQLATQLHTDVAKTDQHILSVDVVKRADEIERLAHSVKERMKG